MKSVPTDSNIFQKLYQLRKQLDKKYTSFYKILCSSYITRANASYRSQENN